MGENHELVTRTLEEEKERERLAYAEAYREMELADMGVFDEP